MNEQSCILRLLYYDSQGIGHFVVECGRCYTIQWTRTLNGPWYFERDGVVGQDIQIEPEPGETRYYRVIPRVCDPDEEETVAIPVPTPG